MLSGSSATHGSALVFEDIPSGSAPLRVRPHEDSLLRVIGGLVRLSTDDFERLLEPGGEAIIPAGSCYRLTSVSEVSRTVIGFRSPRVGRDDRID